MHCVVYWPCQSLLVWPNGRLSRTGRCSPVWCLCGQNRESAGVTERHTAGTPPADSSPPPYRPGGWWEERCVWVILWSQKCLNEREPANWETFNLTAMINPVHAALLVVEVTVYLRHDDVVEIAEEARLLSEDVVWRCGVGDSQSSGQGRVGAERQGEVVLPQEGEKRGGLTREELQSHGSTWQTRGTDNDVGSVVLGCVDAVTN